MANERMQKVAKRYKARQSVHRIGADYQPAIQAVRGEAPSLSRCSRNYYPPLEREIHTLSSTETAASFVALAYPGLVDLLEQRCLPTGPDVHPVSLYPEMRVRPLPGLPGTLVVADQCGLFAFHPQFLSEDGDEVQRIPLPLVGDMLLILRDAAGLYAVNWTVKACDEGFHERLNRRPARRASLQSQLQAEARLRIETECYAQAGIPTHKVTSITFDKVFVANLRMCAAWLPRPINLDLSSQSAMIERYREIIDLECTPLDLLETLMQQFDCSRQDCLTVFYQAVWRCELQVDLFRPVLFDSPMKSMEGDRFAKYAKYFSRSGK